MNEIAQEDSLRLNVLLTQDVKAIRINESSMTLFALLKSNEAKIQLHPNFNDERYLKQIKEMLSTHYLNSPAGFPVFMSRWTRMQQAGNQNLDALLKIGEPEAIVYAVNSPAITPEQASYAWWAMPSVEVALSLLSKPQIAQSKLATELANFLLEFLPFETDTRTITRSVQLLLENNLLSDSDKQLLWKKGQRKANYLIGFLFNAGECIPQTLDAHPLHTQLNSEKHQSNNAMMLKIQFCLSPQGQNYLNTLNQALDKFSDQDSIISLFQIMHDFFHGDMATTQDEIVYGDILMDQHRALKSLAAIDDSALNDVLSHSSAVGSVLRKQLDSVCQPIKNDLAKLINTAP